MNTRIKELAEQADIKFDKDLNEIDVCVLLPLDLEKFAKLIIKECVQVIYDRVEADGDANDEWDGGYRSGMCAAARYVEESFGDEE